MMDSNEYSCIGDINIDVLKESLLLNNWDSLSFDRAADTMILGHYLLIHIYIAFFILVIGEA